MPLAPTGRWSWLEVFMLLTGATVYDCGWPTGRARFGFVRTGSRALARRSARRALTDEVAPLLVCCEDVAEGRCVRVGWESVGLRRMLSGGGLVS